MPCRTIPSGTLPVSQPTAKNGRLSRPAGMLFAVLALTLATSGASAEAVRVSGELSDRAWLAAPSSDGFVQREPEEGGAPSQRTEFRVIYDASTLHVMVRAFDTDASH